MSPTDQAAIDLSAYLTLGMHHSTPEGRAAMAAIVDASFEDERCRLRREIHDASYRAHADRIAELERQIAVPVQQREQTKPIRLLQLFTFPQLPGWSGIWETIRWQKRGDTPHWDIRLVALYHSSTMPIGEEKHLPEAMLVELGHRIERDALQGTPLKAPVGA